jgi:hypothetical protein
MLNFEELDKKFDELLNKVTKYDFEKWLIFDNYRMDECHDYDYSPPNLLENANYIQLESSKNPVQMSGFSFFSMFASW